MSQDKTLIIAAVAVGAYLLTRRRVAANGTSTTAAQRLFAASNQSAGRAGINPAIYGNNQQAMFGQVGSIINNLIGKVSGATGAASSASDYTKLFNPASSYSAAATAVPDLNVYAQAGADATSNPFGLYPDNVAANPAPSFGSVYDAGASYTVGGGQTDSYMFM